MELELTLRTNTGKADVFKYTIYSYSYRLPVSPENGGISLDITLYDQVPQPVLRLAVGQYQSADAVIILSGTPQRNIAFRNVKMANQLYESASHYPGSSQTNSSLYFTAETCNVDGVEFTAQTPDILS